MQDQIFKTADIWLSAHLLTCGMELLGSTPVKGAQHQVFVFQDDPKRDEYVEEFITGKTPNYRYSRMYRICTKSLKNPVVAE